MSALCLNKIDHKVSAKNCSSLFFCLSLSKYRKLVRSPGLSCVFCGEYAQMKQKNQSEKQTTTEQFVANFRESETRRKKGTADG